MSALDAAYARKAAADADLAALLRECGGASAQPAIKLCKDCQHFGQRQHFNVTLFICEHPAHGVEPVMGKPIRLECEAARAERAELCGPEGFAFERRQEARPA